MYCRSNQECGGVPNVCRACGVAVYVRATALYLALPVFLLRSLRLSLSAPPFVFPLELLLRL